MKIKDIIYKEDAIKALHEEWDGGWIEVTGEWVADNCEAVLNRLPSADRPQGEWIGYEVPSECSVCGHCWDEYVFGQEIWYDGSVPNYCPHCGARMKGVDDESG